MERRDVVSETRFRRIFLILLAAKALAAAEAPAVRTRPAIRYEPIAIVSQWGPPLVRAEIGRFRVPENRASGSSRQIELAFARIPALPGTSASAAPVLWLSGGPGDSGIADLNTPALQLFLELRHLGDVILLDQRGTGASVPRLDCPGYFQFPRDLPMDRSIALAQIETAARICAEKWSSAGVDLSSYNTRESAEDVEDLRMALGAPKLRIMAGSYGTHLALAALRAHEGSFERAALLGIVGLDHLRRSPADSDEQLGRIARLAAGELASGSRSENLVALIRRIRDRLAARPAAVESAYPSGERRRIVVGAFDLEWYTRSLLTARNAIAHVPSLFLAMDDGDFSELARASEGWRSARTPSATVFSQRCSSAASKARETRIAVERSSAALGDATDFAQASVCRAWGIAPLPDDFREPVRSAVPALFVSGTLDGDAPESNAVEVMQGFPNGVHLRVEGAAHALLGFEDPATRDAILQFLGYGRLRKTLVSLPTLAFERRERGQAPLLAGGSPIAVPSSFGAFR